MDRLACMLDQLAHQRAFLERALADVDGAAARARLTPGGPSIAWEAGHCAANADSMLALVCGAPRLLGEAFEARGADPDWGVASDAQWEELRATLARVVDTLAEALGNLTEGDLDREPAEELHPAFRGRLTTRGQLLRGHLFHLAYHLGQVGLLRAARGLGW